LDVCGSIKDQLGGGIPGKKADPLGYCRHLGALEGHSQLDPCPSRQSRVFLFSQDLFSRAHRNLHLFFGQKLFNNGISLALPSYYISFIRCDKLLNGRNLLGLHALFFAALFQSRFYLYDM